VLLRFLFSPITSKPYRISRSNRPGWLRYTSKEIPRLTPSGTILTTVFNVPCHGLFWCHGPFVYLGEPNGTFTDIRDTCGFSNLSRFNDYDSTDWHGLLGCYDNDGDLDLYIAEGGKGHSGGTVKRDLLFHGNGDGTFTYVSVTQRRGIQQELALSRNRIIGVPKNLQLKAFRPLEPSQLLHRISVRRTVVSSIGIDDPARSGHPGCNGDRATG
jgi:hypothetical protein